MTVKQTISKPVYPIKYTEIICNRLIRRGVLNDAILQIMADGSCLEKKYNIETKRFYALIVSCAE